MLIKDRGSALSRRRLVLPLTFPSLALPLSCAQAGRDARGCGVESPGGCGEGKEQEGEAARGPGGQVAPHVPSAPGVAGGKELPVWPWQGAVVPDSRGWALFLTHCACACCLQGCEPGAAAGKDESVKICHCFADEALGSSPERQGDVWPRCSPVPGRGTSGYGWVAGVSQCPCSRHGTPGLGESHRLLSCLCFPRAGWLPRSELGEGEPPGVRPLLAAADVRAGRAGGVRCVFIFSRGCCFPSAEMDRLSLDPL